MAAEWSSSGRDLLVTLDRERPLRAQLEAQLRTAIRTGRLAADERLPSTRTWRATSISPAGWSRSATSSSGPRAT